MATRTEVERFLQQFKVKVDVFGVFFLNRDKNLNALNELGITPIERLSIVKSIEVEDFSDGPIKDQLNDFGEMWVFGKDVVDKEVYIKITLGKPNMSTIVVSFHVSEYPLSYLFRNKD